MNRILIEISRNCLYSGEFDAAKRTIHTDKTEAVDLRIALNFLYRFFAGVVLND